MSAVIDQFLMNYKSKSTRRTYKACLMRFFRVIRSDPETYFDESRDYENDVKKYWQNLSDSPPKTIFSYLAAVRVFLSENNIELPAKFWRNIRNRTQGNRAVTEDIIPSNQQLKKILSHADVRGRAVFLFLSSSGMRIGELCQIKLSDINLDTEPPIVHVRAEYTKTGNRRICFVSLEAADAIRAWLKHREKYLKSACNRARVFEKYHNRKEKKTMDDNRLFPFSKGTVRDIWNRLLDNAELSDQDERTKIHKMHLHVLRKFFRTRMAVEIPIDVTEALLGHEGYLTEAYRRYSDEQLGELYLKGVHTINVFESQPDLSGVHKELDDVRSENIRMKEEMQRLRFDLLEVKLAQVQDIQRKKKNK